MTGFEGSEGVRLSSLFAPINSFFAIGVWNSFTDSLLVASISLRLQLPNPFEALAPLSLTEKDNYNNGIFNTRPLI